MALPAARMRRLDVGRRVKRPSKAEIYLAAELVRLIKERVQTKSVREYLVRIVRNWGAITTHIVFAQFAKEWVANSIHILFFHIAKKWDEKTDPCEGQVY